MKFRIERKKSEIELDFYPISSYADFDLLFGFLEEEFEATVSERTDGPDARAWVLEVQGVRAKMIHVDDIGNSLVSEDAAALSIFERIARELADRVE